MGFWDSWECMDCTWLDPKDKKYGECYCPKIRRYVKPDSSSCRHFEKKQSNDGCYLTTAMCEILGYEDHSNVLESMRMLRDNYMVTKEEYTPILKQYRIIGPTISQKLLTDPNQKRIAHIMLVVYLKEAYEYLKNNELDKAIDTYINMTFDLMNHYDLTETIEECKKTTGPNIARKRELLPTT